MAHDATAPRNNGDAALRLAAAGTHAGTSHRLRPGLTPVSLRQEFSPSQIRAF